MNKLAIVGFVAAGCIALAGCASNKLSRAKYIADGEPISGTAEQATVYDLDSGVQSLMAKMRKHPTFLSSYEALKARVKGTPSMQILSVKCNFPAEDFKSRISMIQMKLSVSMFESEMFVVRDTELAEAIEMKSPVPDCLLQGSVCRVQERGGCYVYRLHVKLTDVHTASIMWEGTETVQKVN